MLAIAATQFPIPSANTSPQGIALGSDGNLWFTETGASKVGVFNPTTGVATDFSTPTPNSVPTAITSSPDGNLWFTEDVFLPVPGSSGSIAKIDPTTHAITEYPINFRAVGIAADRNGNIWLAGSSPIAIGEFVPSTQTLTFYNLPSHGEPQSITLGPDGNLWFTESGLGSSATSGFIGEINPATHVLQEFPVPVPNTFGIAAGPDGNLWFTANPGAQHPAIGSINPTTHAVTTYPLQDFSQPWGIASGPGTYVTFAESGLNQIGAIDTITHSFRFTTNISARTDPAGMTTGPRGNPWFIGSTNNTIGEVRAVPDIATTITLFASTDPAVYRSTYNIIATVAPASGGPINSGAITLTEDGTDVGTLAVVNGQADFSVGAFVLGNHQFVAQYSGSEAFTASTSPVLTTTVVRIPSTTTLQVSSNPAYVGDPLTLTATVTPSLFFIPPQGSVEFFDGATPIGIAPYQTFQAVLTYTPTTAGVHPITAAYLGDSVNAPSTSAPSAVTIYSASATTTTLYPSMNPVPINGMLTLTATVTSSTGSGVPTGRVFFNVGNNPSVPLDARGVATLTVSAASIVDFIGQVNLIAGYSGDANFKPSSSGPVSEYIGPPDGPQVFTVVRPTVSSLVLTFNGPLHPATAQDPDNYFLTGPGFRKIKIKSAGYDDATNSVTLTPVSVLGPNPTYFLTVIGTGPLGVTDTEGRLLDGEYVGHPGSNFVTVVPAVKPVVSHRVPAGPKLNARALQIAALRAEMAAYRASLAAARHRR